MDYKEEYQKALERAKKGLPIDEVFPELKESKDERIMEQIVQVLIEHDWSVTYKVRKGDCIAWLGRQKEQALMWKAEKQLRNAEKKKEQKPAEWNEEDEYKVDDICKLIEHATIIPRSGDDDTGIPPTRLNDKYKGELKAFIKSLKDRGNFPKSNTNSPSEWSEKDKKIIGRLRSVVNECAFRNDALDVNGDYCEGDYGELDNWLKSFPERFNLQSKQEWSKEDESYLQTVINEMEANKKEAWEYEHKKYDTIILWLKSLRPQLHWKPSEEQMEALKETAEWKRYSNPQLFSLYEELKKQI